MNGRPLDLLFLTQTYPRFEGDTAGPFIRDLARGLVRLGDRVTVLAPHAEGMPARWEDRGVETVTFRYAPERYEVLGYGRSLEADERVKGGAAIAAPLYALGLLRAVRRARRFDLMRFLRAQVPTSISRPCNSMLRFNTTGCTSVNAHTSIH